MIKRIDIPNLNNIAKSNNVPYRKTQNEVFKIMQQEDEFLKSDAGSTRKLLTILKDFLARVNFSSLVKRLINSRYWTDGMNFVDLSSKENKIHSVGIGMFDKNLDEVKIHKVSVDEFSDIMKTVTAMKLLENSAKVGEIKKLYLELQKFIKENTFNR